MLPTPGSACRLLTLALLASSAIASTAQAQRWDGSADNDWFNPSNWDIDRVPTRDDFEVYVDTNANNPVVIAGDGIIVNLARLYIGPDNRAALTVQDGAKLIVDGQSGIGGGQITGTAGNGTMLISDAGTEVRFGAQIYAGSRTNSTGTLTVRNGAVLLGGDSAIFGTAEGSVARVTVSGAGSRIEMPGALYMGGNITTPDTYDAELNLLDGGKIIGGASVSHGIGNGARVTISGGGSELRAATSLGITGRMRIEDGGALQYDTVTSGGNALIEVDGGLLHAAAVGSSGGLTLGGDSRVIGTGGEIRIGSGLGMFDNSALTLDGTDLRAQGIRMLGNATLNFGAADGAAPGTAGAFDVTGITLEQPGTRLVFNHAGEFTVAAPIHGSGTVLHRAGTTTLTNGGNAGFSGVFDVTGGTVLLDGILAAGEVRISNGATFGGSGTLRNGRLAMMDGTLSPGGGATGTLTLAALALSPDSILDFQLGQPDQAPGVGNDFLRVSTPDGSGALVLDGTLNISDAGGFGAGVYRLIDYRGPLTDNGLELGVVPTNFAAAGLALQTSIAGQINLAVDAPAGLFSFWDGGGVPGDGIVTGGTGIWNANNGNWTRADGASSGAYDPSALLIFAGTGGAVGVSDDTGAIIASAGMQFAADGYRVEGDSISFGNTATTIRVGDGSNAGSAFIATIAAPLTEAAALTKTDLGTLALIGQAAIDGGLTVQAGTLAVRSGGALSGNGVAVETGATLEASGAGTRLTIGGTAPGDIRGDLLITDGAVVNLTPARIQLGGSLSVMGGAQLVSANATQGWLIGQDADFLLSGAGSSFVTDNNVIFSASLGGQAVGNAVISDGASMTVNAPGHSEIAFGVPRMLEVRDGASLTFNGGGLMLNRGALEVRGASVAMDGTLVMGSVHGDNILTLIDAQFRAAGITGVASSPGTIINLGGTQSGPAGSIGSFEVPTLMLASARDALVINHGGPRFTLETVISGAGTLFHVAGDTRLTGISTGFDGVLDLTGGHVRIDGQLGGDDSHVLVSNGATLSGAGTIGGLVGVTAGTIAPGGDPVREAQLLAFSAAPPIDDRVGLLTIAGTLDLTAESHLVYQLGAPDGEAGVDGDLINVGGDLVLDGTLNVLDAGGFGAGVYRLINYDGALTDNDLAIGITPSGYAPGDLAVQTALANQVNLIVSVPVNNFTFWDGAGAADDAAVAGGAGAWTGTAANWTVADGSRNGAYDRSQLLIFAGTAGTVTLDDAEGAITVGAGMQFVTDGYRLTGDAIGLTGEGVQLRVGDGISAGITATIDAALTGTASVAKTDLGTLVLTGANSYSGGTSILQGTIRAAASSIPGDVAIAPAGTLHFDQAADDSYAASISGSGLIRKSGGGTLALTGDSMDFTGATRAESGTLALGGALGGVTRIDAGALLTGAGRLGSLDSAGTVAPGGRTATLSLAGDLIFRAGSTYAVDLAASGGTDLIDAAGRATIEGGTVVVTTLDPETNYQADALYRILQAAGGLTGSFSGLNEQSAFLDFGLEYDSNGASIRIRQVQSLPDVALTYNQRQAANGLGELDRTAGSDGLAVYNSILMLDADAARSAFDLSSGEIYASLLGSEQRRALNLAGQYALRSVAAIEEGLGLWGGVAGQAGHVATDGNGARFTQDSAGFEMGIDYRGEANGWAVGLGGGWQSGGLHTAARMSHADTDSWYLGGYARYGNAGAGFTATANVVQRWTEARVSREIMFGAISRTASAKPAISTTAGRADVRYGMHYGNWSFGPVAGIDAAVSRMDAFVERGAQALNLSARNSRDDWARYGVGAFARLDDGNGNLDLSARLVTGARNDADVDFVLAGSPRQFNIRAPRTSATGGLVEANGHYRLGGNWSLAGEARLLMTSGDTDVIGGLRLSYLF